MVGIIDFSLVLGNGVVYRLLTSGNSLKYTLKSDGFTSNLALDESDDGPHDRYSEPILLGLAEISHKPSNVTSICKNRTSWL